MYSKTSQYMQESIISEHATVKLSAPHTAFLQVGLFLGKPLLQMGNPITSTCVINNYSHIHL